MSARTRAYLMILTVSFIWGIAPPIAKHGLNFLTPSLYLTYRFFISIIIMLPILLILEKNIWSRLSQLTLTHWLLLITSSLLGSTVQIGLLFWGLSLTSSFEGSVITSLSPLFTAVAAYFFLHEHLSNQKKIGYMLTILGTAAIIIQPLFESHKLGFSPTSTYGNFLILLGTIAWSAFVIISKKNMRAHLSPLFLSTAMFFVGFISMLIITIFSQNPYQISKILSSIPSSVHYSVLFMSIFSGSLAYYFHQQATKTLDVADVDIFLYLSPVFTLPVSYFFLHERISILLIFSCVVIAIGVAFAEIKIRQRF